MVPSANSLPPSTYILLKLASTCNLACTYCYWFRDPSVRKRPSLLALEVENAFLRKLESHITGYGLNSYFILFHGGEPLLFGKKRFKALCEKILTLATKVDCKIKLSVTTNGTLLDAEWVNLFKHYEVSPTLSIDSTAKSHDERRIDLRGRGSFQKVMRALETLRENGVEPGILSVFDPEVDPAKAISHITETLKIKSFDILIPDATHDDEVVAPIAEAYIAMFDSWRSRSENEGYDFRLCRNIVSALVGLDSSSESVGLAPVTTSTLLTDGSLEPLDILRIAGDGHTATAYNIFDHDLDDVRKSPLWEEVYMSSITLPAPCRSCEFMEACGGGLIANRWSKTKRYDNPSVYCSDLKAIYRHAKNVIAQSTYLEYGANGTEVS